MFDTSDADLVWGAITRKFQNPEGYETDGVIDEPGAAREPIRQAPVVVNNGLAIPVPDAVNLGPCRDCGGIVLWGTTTGAKRIPLDVSGPGMWLYVQRADGRFSQSCGREAAGYVFHRCPAKPAGEL